MNEYSIYELMYYTEENGAFSKIIVTFNIFMSLILPSLMSSYFSYVHFVIYVKCAQKKE